MGVTSHRRRAVLAGLGATFLLPNSLHAEPIIELTWADLLPEGQPVAAPMIPELLSHEGPGLSASQPPSMGVRAELDQKIVRLPGFVVPLEHSRMGVTDFILVPFVGACVHVPPPPANQLVFVTTETPFKSNGLSEAVTVTGLLGATPMSTHLAEIGYVMTADEIVPYGT